MFSKDKLRGFAKRLIAKTKAGDVPWEIDNDYYNSCILNLGESCVRIQLTSRSGKPDELEFSVLDGTKENPMATLLAEDAPDNPDWALLRELYDEAARIAYGWDRVLAEV